MISVQKAPGVLQMTRVGNYSLEAGTQFTPEKEEVINHCLDCTILGSHD